VDAALDKRTVSLDRVAAPASKMVRQAGALIAARVPARLRSRDENELRRSVRLLQTAF
jgi:hypothetical protein